jgi:hypothetical protein
MKKTRQSKSAQRAKERRRKLQIEREARERDLRAEQDRQNRALDAAEEAMLRRQLAGPCPRCSHTPLVVYMHGADLDNEDVDRIELVTEKILDQPHTDAVCTSTADRLIYCPNCGALHEIGGETHYPQSGVVGGPQAKEHTLEELEELAELAESARRSVDEEGLVDAEQIRRLLDD